MITKGQFLELRHWRNGLTPILRERVQIRLYQTIPNATMVSASEEVFRHSSIHTTRNSVLRMSENLPETA